MSTPTHHARNRLRIAMPGLRSDGWIPDLAACTGTPAELVTGPDSFRGADAVVLHVPDLIREGLPPIKEPGQIWVAWSMESQVHYPLVDRARDVDRIFDLWMTYQRSSDVWCPYLNAATLPRMLAPPGPKPETAPIAAFISGRADRSGRTDYLAELMRHIAVDSYGTVLNTRQIENDGGKTSKLTAISRYRFTIAFENAIDPDYVTEKLYQPLMAGSVPVYLGAPNVAEFAPSPASYIDVRDFRDPAHLARHLLALCTDETAYAVHHAWRSQPLADGFVGILQSTRSPPVCRLLARLRRMRTAE
jgi:hypothetical protein